MAIPRISVLMPVYNGGDFLEPALRSVLAQSVRDFELIALDDGSSDGSLAVMQRLAAGDGRIRVISRPNRGLVHTLNEGIAAAKGEWIARMDADDLCVPDRFERQLAWCQREHLDVCGGWIRTFGSTLARVRGFPGAHDGIRAQLLFNSAFAHPAVLVRRALLLENPYDPAMAHAEDYDLWTRLVAAGARLGNYPGVVLHYRVHGQQVSVTRRHEQDAARARIAAAYRAAEFPDLDADAHAALLSRLALLPAARIEAAVAALAGFRDRHGDPEGVIGDNGFLFLARHAELGLPGMVGAAGRLGLSGKRRLVLLTLALLRAHQHSALFKLLYRYR